MAPSNGQPDASGGGFEGAIRGLEISDVIQFNVQNRFSGCLAIQNGEARGLVYFHEGAIVHAEHATKAGEEAFYDILGWPNGRFGLQPGLAAPHSSITKSWQHLLMEARQIQDERSAARNTLYTPPVPPEPAAKPQEQAAKTSKSNEMIEKVRAVPGVLFTVLQTKDGNRVGDQSFEAEVLAGQGAFLAMVGNQLASVFQTGELFSAAVQGSTRHLLLFGSKNHYLCVLVNGTSPIGPVEAEVRRVLNWTR